MLIFNRHAALSEYISSIKENVATIGFVPTMGALHHGHLSLLKQSLSDNLFTVISIFVNPTQFNNAEDLAKYPRTVESDIEKIRSVSTDIIIFTPSVDDIYNGNTVSKHFEFGGLENELEGKFRPGHFDGVATIVKRLLEIVKPTNAYFGEKDFQQLQIVRRLVALEKIPVTIIECEIYRESNGLAMSSRNERLSSEDRNRASIIYQTLLTAKEFFGTKTVKQIADFVKAVFGKIPGFELEYFEIAEVDSLVPSTAENKHLKYRAFIAVFVNNVRLIDTISLN